MRFQASLTRSLTRSTVQTSSLSLIQQQTSKPRRSQAQLQPHNNSVFFFSLPFHCAPIRSSQAGTTTDTCHHPTRNNIPVERHNHIPRSRRAPSVISPQGQKGNLTQGEEWAKAAINKRLRWSERKRKEKEKGKVGLRAIIEKNSRSVLAPAGPGNECREMRGIWLKRSEVSGQAKRRIGGRNCHRKHVEDG